MHTGFWWEDHLEDVNIGGVGDNIKMGIQEVGWGTMDWIDLAEGIDSGRGL